MNHALNSNWTINILFLCVYAFFLFSNEAQDFLRIFPNKFLVLYVIGWSFFDVIMHIDDVKRENKWK